MEQGIKIKKNNEKLKKFNISRETSDHKNKFNS